MIVFHTGGQHSGKDAGNNEIVNPRDSMNKMKRPADEDLGHIRVIRDQGEPPQKQIKEGKN